MSLVFRNWLECALWFFPLFFILLWLHWPCWFYVYVFITSENLSAIIFVTFSSPLCPLLWSPFHLCWAGCYCSRSHWGCLCSILDMLCYNVSYSLLFLFVGSDLLLTTSSGFFCSTFPHFSPFFSKVHLKNTILVIAKGLQCYYYNFKLSLAQSCH